MSDSYDNSNDTYLELKGIGIEESHSATFDGGAIGKDGAELFTDGKKKRIDFRFNPEFSMAMLTGLVNLYPTVARDLVAAAKGATNNDLATENGTKLSIHLGRRKHDKSGREFNAGFAYLKPLQYAPGKGPSSTGKKTARIVKAVSGDATVPSPGSFKK